jgi:simple sugar transport system permease protein
VGSFSDWELPLLSEIPALGTIFFDHTILTYCAFLIVPVVSFLLFRTTWGLRIRAAGESPEAAAALGVDVARVRWLAVLFTGIMAGIGGAALSIGSLGFFSENMTAGRGFIALAAVIFGRWKPLGATVAVLLFSFADALQVRVQAVGVLDIPHQFLLMLPYLVTVLTLAIFLRRMRPPAALGVPYRGA